MGSDFDSFDQGELLDFQESDLKERGGGKKYGGQLLICGAFQGSDGQAGNVLKIARFDGTQWNPLGNHSPVPNESTDGQINTMAFLNGELYAAGSFTKIGDVISPRLAKYDADDDTWIPILGSAGGIQNGSVNHMVEHQGMLFLCGTFTSVNGIAVFGIIAFDGNDYVYVGNPTSNPLNFRCNRLVSYNGQLILGGNLGNANIKNSHRASRWNGGTSWTFQTNFQNNFFAQIEEFGIHNGVLYASATNNYLFTHNNTEYVPPAIGYWMAKYTGSVWAPFKVKYLDTGSNVVRSIISYNGELILSIQTSEYLRRVVFTPFDANFPDGQTAAYPIPNGLRFGPSYDMILWKGELVLDGNGQKNPGAINPVASWNGSRWLQLGIMSVGASQFAVFPED